MVRHQVRALRLALASAAVLLLAGCGGGGGGGSSTPSSPPLPPTPRTVPMEFCYFGVQRRLGGESDIAETADHVTCLYLVDWGNWDTPEGRTAIADRIVTDLEEGRAHGIRKAIVACGFEVFTSKYVYRGNGSLQVFRQRVSDLGLLGMVAGISLVDEPDMRDKGISDATMTTAFRDAKAAWPEAKIAVIYGDGGGFPGKDAAQLIGRDMYDKGAGVLALLPAIDVYQQYILVPGGCDPWKADPRPFHDFGQAHREVWGLVNFRWFDHASGAGIRSNGMAQAYRAVGAKIKST